MHLLDEMDKSYFGRDAWTHFDDDQEVLGSSTSAFNASAFSTPPHITGGAFQNASTRIPGPWQTFSIANPPEQRGDHIPDFHTVLDFSTPHSPQQSTDERPRLTGSLDPWAISSEQKSYYLSQFLRLQPDVRSKLSGLQAKDFFELSKLPNAELSDIWELSDTDCDGQLTLGEFCVAMHLVVLRKNGIPIPHVLPPVLLEVVTGQALSTSIVTEKCVGETDPTSTVCASADPIQSSASTGWDCWHPSPTSGPRFSQGSMVTPSVFTPPACRQRRWSVSSQSDISSLAEGIIQFDSRLNAGTQLQHPIPLRARTLPWNNNEFGSSDPQCARLSLLHKVPPPPPPPPRVHPVCRSENTQPNAPSQSKTPCDGDSTSPPLAPPADTVDLSPPNNQANEAIAAVPTDPQLSPNEIIAQLQRDCDGLLQANEQLAVELVQLQQHRIALKILLERLMPLDTGYSECREY